MTATPANGQGPTDDELLDALWADPRIQEGGKEYFEISKPFSLALLTLLADQLDQPVTVSIIMTAKLAFIRYCVEHDFVGTLRRDLSAEIFGSQADKDEELGDLEELMAEIIEQFPGYDPKAAYEALGLTEAEAMTSPEIRLSEEAKVLYLADPEAFTVRELLRHSPSALVRFGPVDQD